MPSHRVAAGLFAPLAALSYGLADLRVDLIKFALIVIVCLAGGGFLHVIGWILLGRLAVGYPFLVIAMALFVVWLTGRLNDREDRRRAQRAVPGE